MSASSGAPPERPAARSIDAPPALWVGLSYFLQGLPFSVVRQVTAYFFTALGTSLQAIGLTSLLGTPWTFKFLWSPLVDARATRRSWLLGCQLVMVPLFVLLAFMAASRHAVSRTAPVLVALAFVAATHDIAVDGFYLEALDAPGQARYSGLQVALYRVAMLFGTGVLVVVAGRTSWRLAYLTAAATLALGMAALAWILPRGEPVKRTRGAALGTRAALATFVEAGRSFVAREGAVEAIAFLLLFKLGTSLMLPMVAPFLRSRGMTTTQMGLWGGTLGTAGSIAGALLGGVIVARRGLARGLVLFGLTQDIAIPLYALAAALHHVPIAAIGLVTGLEQLAGGLGTAAYINFVMRQCAPEHRASHFAFATSLMSLTVQAGGAASGYLAHALGFARYFGLASLLAIPSVVLSLRCARRPECQT